MYYRIDCTQNARHSNDSLTPESLIVREKARFAQALMQLVCTDVGTVARFVVSSTDCTSFQPPPLDLQRIENVSEASSVAILAIQAWSDIWAASSVSRQIVGLHGWIVITYRRSFHGPHPFQTCFYLVAGVILDLIGTLLWCNTLKRPLVCLINFRVIRYSQRKDFLDATVQSRRLAR